MKRAQCQACVTSANARCSKPAVRGTKYCWWHQSKGLFVVSLVAGAVLSLALSEAWRALVPTTEHKELRALRTDYAKSLKAPDLHLFLNGAEVFDRSVVAIPVTNHASHLELIVQNAGNLVAEDLKVSIKFPVEVPGLRVSGFWTEQQASFASDGKVRLLPDKSYVIQAQGSFAPGDTFGCTPLAFDRTIATPETFSMHIRLAAKQAETKYVPVTILLVPGLRDQIVTKGEPESLVQQSAARYWR